MASPILTELSQMAHRSEPEVILKFVSFPVAMPGDKELTWSLAKRENMINDEAPMALTTIEDDFWGSKTGKSRFATGSNTPLPSSSPAYLPVC